MRMPFFALTCTPAAWSPNPQPCKASLIELEEDTKVLEARLSEVKERARARHTESDPPQVHTEHLDAGPPEAGPQREKEVALEAEIQALRDTNAGLVATVTELEVELEAARAALQSQETKPRDPNPATPPQSPKSLPEHPEDSEELEALAARNRTLEARLQAVEASEEGLRMKLEHALEAGSQCHNAIAEAQRIEVGVGSPVHAAIDALRRQGREVLAASPVVQSGGVLVKMSPVGRAAVLASMEAPPPRPCAPPCDIRPRLGGRGAPCSPTKPRALGEGRDHRRDAL